MNNKGPQPERTPQDKSQVTGDLNADRPAQNVLEYGKDNLPARSGALRAFYSAKASILTLLGGRSAWGLADQLLISFTNFVTMILVARGLHDKAAFGTFTLVYSALLFANVIQFALITQPHNVLGSTRQGDDYKLYTTASAAMQVALAFLLGIIAVIVAGGAAMAHASFTSQLVALVPSIVAWQLQEFIRRVLYTEGRMAGAFLNDLVSYGGQTLITGLLWWQSRLTGALALWALAITSAAACVLGAWQIHGSLVRRISRQAILDTWHYGKWLLGSEILIWCSSLQMFLYLAAIIIGTAASGTLRAAQILFGPTRVFSFFLQTVLPIRFSRAVAGAGNAALASQMRRAFLLVSVLLGPYCLLLAIFPTFVLSKIFDPSYAEHPTVLSLFSLQAMLSYWALVVTAALSAKRMTRDIFLASVCGTAVALAVSWPLIHFVGTGGAVGCMMASTLVMTAFLVWRFLTHQRPVIEKPKEFILETEEQACAT